MLKVSGVLVAWETTLLWQCHLKLVIFISFVVMISKKNVKIKRQWFIIHILFQIFSVFTLRMMSSEPHSRQFWFTWHLQGKRYCLLDSLFLLPRLESAYLLSLGVQEVGRKVLDVLWYLGGGQSADLLISNITLQTTFYHTAYMWTRITTPFCFLL